MNIIDGKAISQKIREDIKAKVYGLKNVGITPGLAVVVVGDDKASRIYVNNKKKSCKEVGIYSREYALPESTTQNELISLIHKLNDDKAIHGILVQLPLPRQINEKAVIESINPKKDVDAFHEINVGKIMLGDYSFLPCTPAGIMKLLSESGIEVAGKVCVVVGRSNIVGKPMGLLLLNSNGTVIMCHSKTQNLSNMTKLADILVVAVGKAKFITGDMIKKGAVVIDVGMNRDENGNLCGDADFESCANVASHITPVPGGVGPMTITMLLQNTVNAAKNFYSRVAGDKI